MAEYGADAPLNSLWLDQARSISWMAERCLGTWEKLQACRQCLDACPVDALAFFPTDSGTQLTSLDSCHGCTRCVASCPSEALTGHDLQQLETELKRRAASGKPAALNLICHRLDVDNRQTLSLHCLHGLPGDQLLEWAVHYPHLRISLHWPEDCNGCPAAKAQATPTALQALAKGLDQHGTTPWLNRQRPATRSFRPHAGYRLGRRQLFARLSRGDTTPPLPPEASRLTQVEARPAPRRHTRLFHALQHLGDDALANQLAPWPQVQLNMARCDASEVCVQQCPSSALHSDAQGNLLFTAEQCLGCKSCERHCPTQALTLTPQLPGSALAAHPLLRTGQQARCFHCGHLFTHNPPVAEQAAAVCSSCRKDPARASGEFSAWFN